MKNRYFIASALFVLFSLMYFLPIDIAHKICIPMAVLFVFSIGMLPWQMCCAMFFSAMGDYAGSCHVFLAQMGFFALAHVFMVVYFINILIGMPRDWRLSRPGIWTMAISLAVTLGIMVFAFICIVPHAPAGVVRIGTAVYCVLISCMLLSASQQRNWIFTLGALLFVLSDTILAWNKFVSPLAASKYLIMVTYYAGQFLLFTGTWRRALKAGRKPQTSGCAE